jgi:hypothetical protein
LFKYQVLMKLRNNDAILVDAELENLEKEKYVLSQQAKVKWSDFWNEKSLFRPLIVTIVIQMSQQFSGNLKDISIKNPLLLR